MKRILLIEDDVLIKKGLTEILEMEGYEVFSETDGLRGYSLAKSILPDLLVLDVMLPSLDGFQICDKLKREGFTFPIFMTTSLSGTGNRLTGLSFGADEYISKPFSAKELLIRINNSLKSVEKIMGRAKVLENEVKIARDIQLNSLPRESPGIKGLDIYGRMLASTYVGGDYFDFVKLQNNMLGVIVADVAGKGMPAALCVQKMQGILQSSAKKIINAEDILIVLQKYLGSTLESLVFVTAIALVFDLDNFFVEIARAGHTPLLLKRNNKVHTITTPGTFISGFLEELFFKSLHQKKIELKDGDSFLLFTDGVIESTNPEGKLYGISRLKEWFISTDNSSLGLVDKCFGEIQKFSSGFFQTDDMTIVSIKVNAKDKHI